MQKIYLDTDVLLDVIAKREPFYNHSALLLSKVDNKQIIGFTTPLVFANLNYIVRKLKSKESAHRNLHKLKYLLRILPLNEKYVEIALNSDFNDFEDALQYYSALDNKINLIITRNISDYQRGKLPVYTPEEFLKII